MPDKCTFSATELVWCGRVHSAGRLLHDFARLRDLADMRRPETAGELMQFLHKFLAFVPGKIEGWCGVAKNRAIPPASWTTERLLGWEVEEDPVAHAVTLFYPRPDCQIADVP
ncbi:unnamed protein product [Scytosiphon promiscuus]